MRLREPFQGYKLSSGHPMFHLAYLVGSYVAANYVLENKDFHRGSWSYHVLYSLNIAHFLVPCFSLGSYICN